MDFLRGGVYLYQDMDYRPSGYEYPPPMDILRGGYICTRMLITDHQDMNTHPSGYEYPPLQDIDTPLPPFSQGGVYGCPMAGGGCINVLEHLFWPRPENGLKFCKVPTFKNAHFFPRYLPFNNFVIFKFFTRYLTYKILHLFFLFKEGTLQKSWAAFRKTPDYYDLRYG